MKYDDRPERAKRLEKARISRGFATAKSATDYFGWSYPTYAQHEDGKRDIIRAVDRYAAAFRVTEAWLLTGDGPQPEEPKVPVMGIAAGAITGFNTISQTPIDFVKRPPNLVNVVDAYAIWVRGSSMLPKFEENELCFVHPHKVPKKGDYIIVQQISSNGEPMAFIKKMISKNDTMLVAQQFNPPATIEYDLKTVIAYHKVIGTNEMFGV